jgi:hypothetical protein
MKGPSPMRPPEHVERFALVGMAPTEDGHTFRIPIEVVMGSVSSLPSTPWTTDNCGRSFANGCKTECCCA